MSNNLLRKDLLFFDLVMLFVLAVMAIVLLYAPVIGSLSLFIPVASAVFIMILAYTLGMQPGLIGALVVTFAYGTYLIYESMVIHRISEVSFGYAVWFLCFPVSAFLAGRLSEVVQSYSREAASKQSLEKLVTVDASTGFYNTQGFFRKLDEEFIRSQRYHTEFSMMLVKITNFDDLHKIYGDVNIVNILKAVADIISKQTRYADIKSIIDGHILAIILTETDIDGAKIVMEKLHQSLDVITTDINGMKKVLRISPSMGVSAIQEGDTDALEIYERAKNEFIYDKG